MSEPANSEKRSRSFLSWWDLPVLLTVLAAVATAILIPRLYRPAPKPFFPRTSSEFLAPAQINEITARARAVLEKNPQDINALTDLAVAAFQEGPDHALECIEYGQRALDLGALDERLFYYTGASYETKGLNGYAAEEFERYLRHHPDDLEIRLRAGNLYYRTGDLDKAQAAFQSVAAVRPGDPLVSFNLAMVLRDRQMWKEGLDVLTPVLDRDKTLPAGGFRVLGDLFHGLKKTDEALAAYRKEAERSPDDADLAAVVAQTLDDAGRSQEALEAWKRVLDLNPKNKLAAAKIRVLHRKLRREARRKR